MKNISIENIITSDEDLEIKKYKILSALKIHETRLRKYFLYPSLTELVNTLVKLEMMTTKAEINSNNPSSTDLFNQDILASEFQTVEEDDEFTELVKWTMYHINILLDEGIAIFEFAENNIKIGQISGHSNKNDEGYFIIPNLEAKEANIYKYESVIYGDESGPITSIKTKHLISFSENELLNKSTEPAVKILMDYINDKGASVFFCSTDAALPYEDTILPVAKKNLHKFLAE